MSVTLENGNQSSCRLVFGASMTLAHARELEDQIIDAMRHHQKLEVDLSGVCEIDICGVHLLGMLKTLGGTGLRIVATSPVVEQQYTRFLSSANRGAALRSDRRERCVEQGLSG